MTKIFAVFLAVALVGCGVFGLGKEKSPAVALFECEVAAFATVVPQPVAEDLVMAARAGQITYVLRQLQAFRLSVADIQAAADAFNACHEPEAPAEAAPEGLPPGDRS